MTSQTPELSIVIPFYDEEANVHAVIDDVVRCLSGDKIDYEIVAVDNGSTDRTGEFLEDIRRKNPRVSICSVSPNQGYGWGIICGLRRAQGGLLGYMWGDGQVDARSLLDIYRRLKETPVHLCKAKRVEKTGYSLFRKLQSWTFNVAFNVTFGVDCSDINGCPKVMRREVYEKVNLTSRDWFIDSELMIKMARLGFSFSEVPVVYSKREKGQTHVRLSTVFEFVRNMIKARLGFLL